MKNLYKKTVILLFSLNVCICFAQILPQQANLVLQARSVLIIRGVDPATHTWKNTDVELQALKNELNDYIKKASYNKTWVGTFDITPVYQFTVDPANNAYYTLEQKLKPKAISGGYNVDNYNVVFYLHQSNTDFGGAGALGVGNGNNGTVYAYNALTTSNPGMIHETFHAFGLGHAECIEGESQIFPGVVKGGHDPYHFMGSEGDAVLNSDIPSYMKYVIGWITPTNVEYVANAGAGCITKRLYRSSIVSNYNAQNKYALQLGKNLWISYEPDNSNTRLQTKGLLFHYIPERGSGVSRLLDMKPNSITVLPPGVGSNYLPVIDFWDAALKAGSTFTWEGNIIEIAATGGTGDQKWADVKICNCVAISGDSDNDGVCNSLDVCDGGDDTKDADFDGSPDKCDICPFAPTNDSNTNGICDNIECLNLNADAFDYTTNASLSGLNGGVGFTNPWTSGPMNGSLTILQGSLPFTGVTTRGNKLKFTLNNETGGNKVASRNLTKPFKQGELWVSVLLNATTLKDGGFWIMPNKIQGIAIGKRYGTNIGIDNNGTNINMQQGRVYRLVARYQLKPTGTVVHLWVDRNSDFTDANADATKTYEPILEITNLDLSFESFGNGAMEIDELKFGCDASSITYTPVAIQLSASPTTWQVASGVLNKQVVVTTNAIWKATSNQSWLSLSNASGSSDGTFTMTATPNTTATSRSAIVTITVLGVTKGTVTVNQAGGTLGIATNQTNSDNPPTVFPNPSDDNITLKIPNYDNIQGIVTIKSSTGQELYRIEKNQFNAEGQAIINISQLATGLYFINYQYQDDTSKHHLKIFKK
jgi:Putative binding domain, N-terminal/Secretion system C-terminal sorting domain